ncbi:Uncharacterised protein [Serratia fonticola]|jgi:hypothetical protein|nr:Uncharacterised protein [Serratia fonticola]
MLFFGLFLATAPCNTASDSTHHTKNDNDQAGICYCQAIYVLSSVQDSLLSITPRGKSDEYR